MDLFLKIESVIRFGANDALFLEYDISSTGIIAIDVQFFIENHDDNFYSRKCQDYVYLTWEYWSTMQKIKHYLRHEHKYIGVSIIVILEVWKFFCFFFIVVRSWGAMTFNSIAERVCWQTMKSCNWKSLKINMC